MLALLNSWRPNSPRALSASLYDSDKCRERGTRVYIPVRTQQQCTRMIYSCSNPAGSACDSHMGSTWCETLPREEYANQLISALFVRFKKKKKEKSKMPKIFTLLIAADVRAKPLSQGADGGAYAGCVTLNVFFQGLKEERSLRKTRGHFSCQAAGGDFMDCSSFSSK